jgi:ADP-dependent NAD(P)H-hydrate dehydratase / NAD(P)H-hydrate epimerase
MVRESLERVDALVVGPGMGRETETLAVVKDLMRQTNLPVVLDADALQPDIVWSGSGPRILTPHAGEFARIASGAKLAEFRPTRGCVTVLKGPVTRVSSGDGRVYHSCEGGPVLARGGSGDLLAGIIGALVAKAAVSFGHGGVNTSSPPEELYAELLAAAASGVFWHGRAAALLAEARGEVAVRATELLDYLGPALVQA